MDIFASGPNSLRCDAGKAARLRPWIFESCARGRVVSLSWHMPNPGTNTNAWDVKTPAVGRILPGDDYHDAFVAEFDVAARFLASLWAPDGALVPVICRPRHEYTGDWFWWSSSHAGVNEIKVLWGATVERHDGLHNLLYAYSTDVFDDPTPHLKRFPGDDVVDVRGFDDYHGIESVATLPRFVATARTVPQFAAAGGKIPAVAETGLEALTDSEWSTDILRRGLGEAPGAAWVLVWRNVNSANAHNNHFGAAYPGRKSADDFAAFTRNPRILLESGLPDLDERRPR